VNRGNHRPGKSIANSELFAGVPSFVIEEVVASTRLREFVSGDVLFFADDPKEHVFLLTDGRAKVSQFSESGKEVILRLIVPGEIISELTLVPGGTHSSTAQALQDCKVLAWDSASFNAALERFPELQKNADHILERRLDELHRRFLVVATKTASPRLANGLVHLLDHVGRRVGSHIEINVSQEALGQMTAMNSSSVCRLLAMWKRQGIVKLRKETIEIHSVAHLLNLAE
jgi:CRP-like cAMP-binding protein